MNILIDADGCPVVDEAVAAAREAGVPCIIICDTAHVFKKDGAQTLTVSKGADAVDFALVNRVRPGDIVITQDYGLAAMCLARKAIPLSQDGLVYDADNIDALLLARHTARKIRMSGGRLRGNAKRTQAQDAVFIRQLRALILAGTQSPGTLP
ncbi:MAG: DUF188 domain-containing protein [Oscillospiraceae bacterium]|jgi:uncharacterized protein YaiI (UPF0178 family)|nr:DUF188 domain-containing protein [Oscillospiraceae bacterium]